MGWASGGAIFAQIVDTIENYVKDPELRTVMYDEIITVFENADCDTVDEILYDDDVDPALRDAFKQRDPEIYSEMFEED